MESFGLADVVAATREQSKSAADAAAPGPADVQEMSAIASCWRYTSYFWSTAVLIFAIVVLYWDMAMDWVGDFDDNSFAGTYNASSKSFDGYSGSADGVYNATPVAVNIVIGTLLLIWVALLEGAQCAIVGLTYIQDLETIKEKYPRSYACCKVVHHGPNTEKFIVGRQFLLLFVVFVISKMFGHSHDRQMLDFHARVTALNATSPTYEDDVAKLNGGFFYMGGWQWSETFDVVFLQNQVLLLIVIIVPGQLVTQLLAAGKMLAFLELPFAPMYTIVYPSMALEWIGITHCAYVIKDTVAKIADKPEDPAKAMNRNWFHYLRCTYSVGIVIFALICVAKGTATDKMTNVWESIEGPGALVLSFVFLFIIGCCEGFQIAAVSLAKLPSSQLEEEYPVAHKVIKRLFAGINLQRFLVGRQVLCALMMIILAKVTSFKNGQFWGFDQWAMDGFLETGILGAIFVVNVGQLSFRMLASCYPVLFINNYLMYGLLEMALAVEATGLFNSCWVLASGLDKLVGLEEDPFFEAPKEDLVISIHGAWSRSVRNAAAAKMGNKWLAKARKNMSTDVKEVQDEEFGGFGGDALPAGTDAEHAAAAKIQAGFRGHMARKDMAGKSN